MSMPDGVHQAARQFVEEPLTAPGRCPTAFHGRPRRGPPTSSHPSYNSSPADRFQAVSVGVVLPRREPTEAQMRSATARTAH